MRPLLRASLAGALAAALVAALAYGLTRDPRELPGVAVGRPAPAFRLEGIDGRRVDGPRRRGRPAVINFWASWCTECRKEHPYLMRAHRRWGARVDFVGIVFQDTPGNIERFLLERGEDPRRTYPNLMDPDGRVAIDYGVYGVPETFFVDRRGKVVAKRVGRVTPLLLRRELGRIAGPG